MSRIVVIGLGYVGLPLAVEFGKHFPTTGVDLSHDKVEAYRSGVDPTGELSRADLASATQLSYATDASAVSTADFVVIAVPTPVDAGNSPDFAALVGATRSVAQYLKPGTTVIYESTVYPGATEEICIPLLESQSGLKWKTDFHVGYSPERVNPGDKERTLTKIVKVVSGDSPATLDAVANLYGSVITAGLHRAGSIKVAEAAKVIENTQRDLNIALMNEFAMIFDRVGIDTLEVLTAAGTKWNFLNFRPGLVGGHCIGVDPYYLTHKAEALGYHPQVILAGRRINDGMASYVAQQTIKAIIQSGESVLGAKVVVLGLAFKENCTDLRNSKVADLVAELAEFGCDVRVHDPLVDPREASHEYGISLSDWDDLKAASAAAIVAAVPHQYYRDLPIDELLAKLQPNGVLIDVKSMYRADEIKNRGFRVWRL